jgi:hypothetical protein
VAVTLPLRTDLPHYEFDVTLEGAVYTLEFRWSARESAWFASIFTETGDPIARSCKVLPGWPLFVRVRDPRMPLGALVPVDTTGDHVAPGLNDLGGRVQVLYYESTELPL